MEAKDTVMDRDRMLCCSLRGKYCFDEVKDIILDTAIAQAEISFKAGARMVAGELQLLILSTEGDSADVPQALRDNLVAFIDKYRGLK